MLSLICVNRCQSADPLLLFIEHGVRIREDRSQQSGTENKKPLFR